MSLNIIITKKVPFARQETSDTITTKLLTLADYLTSYTDRPLLGLGVSTVGVVDTINGRITYITDFFNIHELEIKSVLERHVDIPVFVKNDMQSAALCEMYFGIGKVKDHFIYLGLTIGVGASIVANQQLLNNMTGSCGELGHMTINYKDGEQCQCGSAVVWSSQPVFPKSSNISIRRVTLIFQIFVKLLLFAIIMSLPELSLWMFQISWLMH